MIKELMKASKSEGKVTWLTKRSLCILDPVLAKRLLDNADGAVLVHSDFFGRLGEQSPTRDNQRAIARDVLRLLSVRLARLRKSGRIMLPTNSVWPEFAFAVAQEVFAGVMIAPERSPVGHERLSAFVRKVVAAPRKGLWSRIDVFRLASSVTKLIDENEPTAQRSADSDPGDLIEVLRKWRAEVDVDLLVRIFFSVIFSVFKSLSLTLTWAIHDLIAGEVDKGDLRQAITKSMTLHPISWMLERYPVRSMTIDDVRVGTKDTLLISPYLLHRMQANTGSAPGLWIPFGGGMHECPAASFGFAYVELILRRLPINNLAFASPPSEPPATTAVLRPPDFTVSLVTGECT